jgi:hypothetical protein
MITRGIRDYMSRDWEAARRAKDAYWSERINRLGPGEGFRIAEELRLQVVRSQPGWPRESERQEDLAAHLKLADLLRRAGRSRRR